MKSIFNVFIVICLMLFWAMGSTLVAQNERWLGGQDLYFKNKTEAGYDSVNNPFVDQGYYFRTHIHDISLGLHMRWTKKEGRYQQAEAMFNTMVKSEYRAFITPGTTNLFSSFRGEKTTGRYLRFGYRRGKMVTPSERWSTDLALGAFVERSRIDTLGLRRGEFNRSHRKIVLSLHFIAGINYQIHDRVHIGYGLRLISLTKSNHLFRTEDPSSQRRKRERDTTFRLFDSMIEWRHFRISYVL